MGYSIAVVIYIEMDRMEMVILRSGQKKKSFFNGFTSCTVIIHNLPTSSRWKFLRKIAENRPSILIAISKVMNTSENFYLIQ